jgi:hypothetical protein
MRAKIVIDNTTKRVMIETTQASNCLHDSTMKSVSQKPTAYIPETLQSLVTLPLL